MWVPRQVAPLFSGTIRKNGDGNDVCNALVAVVTLVTLLTMLPGPIANIGDVSDLGFQQYFKVCVKEVALHGFFFKKFQKTETTIRNPNASAVLPLA